MPHFDVHNDPDLVDTLPDDNDMATTASRPLPTSATPSSSRGLRRLDTIEVIDVDLLDDDEVQIIGSRPPPQPVAGSSRPRTRSRATANRRTEERNVVYVNSDEEAPSTSRPSTSEKSQPLSFFLSSNESKMAAVGLSRRPLTAHGQ